MPRLIVGLGGGSRPNSATSLALLNALAAAAPASEVSAFGTDFLQQLPHYDPSSSVRSAAQTSFLGAMRRASGLIIATPAYHGGVPGLVKNAIDLLEDTARDARPYLDGLPVGLIVTAAGWQATGTTLQALRAIVHALRGWPTPLGVAINTTAGPIFSASGRCEDAAVAQQLDRLGRQVGDFAATFAAHAAPA